MTRVLVDVFINATVAQTLRNQGHPLHKDDLYITRFKAEQINEVLKDYNRELNEDCRKIAWALLQATQDGDELGFGSLKCKTRIFPNLLYV